MYNNDIIKSTDLNERLDEIVSDDYAWITDDAIEIPDDELAIHDEYTMLVNIIDDGKAYNSEWDNGIDLISAAYFTDYIKQYYIDMGIVTEESLNAIVVDWHKTSNKALSDYNYIVIDCHKYFIRVN